MVTNDVNYKDVNFCENYMYIKMTSDVNYKMVIEQLEQNSGANGCIILSAPKKPEKHWYSRIYLPW